MSKNIWKKGRGKLGFFTPLLGSWTTEKLSTDIGTIQVAREFSKILDGKYIELKCHWQIGTEGKSYSETCLFGVGDDKNVHFWSFTSDGKRSEGWLTEAPDIHPNAICFEADMPAGHARQVYWPADDGGFHWAVESQTKKGWNRFVSHHYKLT